jgi:hypothetical protein
VILLTLIFSFFPFKNVTLSQHLGLQKPVWKWSAPVDETGWEGLNSQPETDTSIIQIALQKIKEFPYQFSCNRARTLQSLYRETTAQRPDWIKERVAQTAGRPPPPAPDGAAPRRRTPARCRARARRRRWRRWAWCS